MSWLENLWNGMSPCTTPGIGNCLVWWEAWTAIVGMIVGLATVCVAILAWRTSRRATDIADGAKRIADQQKSVADKLLESQRKILEQMLYHEVAGIAIEVEKVREMLGYGFDLSLPSGVAHPASLDFALKRCQEDWLPVTKTLQDKLYVLNNGHGEVMAQLIGASISISAFAKEISDDWFYEPMNHVNNSESWVFGGDSGMLESLWNAVDEFSVTATYLSSQFVKDVKRVKLY